MPVRNIDTSTGTSNRYQIGIYKLRNSLAINHHSVRYYSVLIFPAQSYFELFKACKINAQVPSIFFSLDKPNSDCLEI